MNVDYDCGSTAGHSLLHGNQNGRDEIAEKEVAIIEKYGMN